MNLLIVTHVAHTYGLNNELMAYGPYVKEVNLWLKYCKQITIVAPLSEKKPLAIDLAYAHEGLRLEHVSAFQLTSMQQIVRAARVIPIIAFRVFQAMRKADHIHLRCPGNMGLIGAVVQIFFPKKPKTAKYAGNWDWNSKQPWSYRLQQRILRSTFLTKNMQVLVYGHWPDATKNIKSFFTASYFNTDRINTPPRKLDGETVKLIFVGGLTPGKQPLLAVKVAEQLVKQRKVELHMYGDGPLRQELESYIHEKGLDDVIYVHGNQPAEVVKTAFQVSHFLVFISKSEGWPKVVAEAMFWGCVPVTTAVSCVPEMIGHGKRGALVKPVVEQIVKVIEGYSVNPEIYTEQAEAAMSWSREFTLDRFDQEIAQLLYRSRLN